MANRLDVDLTGKVVLVRTPPGIPKQSERMRKFRCEGGFGCRPYTAGMAIFGHWLYDDSEGRIDGSMVDKIVEE
jgi:hypothetical protein